MKKRGRIRIDGTIDLECAQWDRVVVAAMYSPRDGHRTFRSVGALVDELLARGGWWWSWSGGTYDTLAIADELLRRGLRALVHLAGARVTRLEVGNFKLCDAYALIPMDLDTACGLAGDPPVGPLGWPCICGGACGGYCRISPSMSESRKRELEGYCVEDARKGYRAIAALVDFAEEHDLDLRGTIGGAAWATAARWIGLPKVDWHWSTWKRVREGYYGGRITVGRAWAPGGVKYDLNSAYPWALASQELPVGDPIELGGDRAGAAYRFGAPGIYRAVVRIPDAWLPPLPYRLPSGRLSFPLGELAGAWPITELEAAEARGAEIVDVISAITWPGKAVLFDDFVGWCYDERQKRGKDTAWGKWLRLFPNSLTGKLAENPERQGVMMHPSPDSIVVCDGTSERSRRAGCSIERCTERCGKWSQIDPWGQIWTIPLFRLGAGAHVHWGAYVTAAIRLRSLEAWEACGDDFLYGHTDSCLTSGAEPPGVGDELGQWGNQGVFGDWHCTGPVACTYVDGNGEVHAKVAGLSATSERAWLFDADHEREIVEARGVRTFREAASSGEGLFKRRRRVIRRPEDTGWRGDRIVAGSDGRTYPVDRGTLEERDRSR